MRQHYDRLLASIGERAADIEPRPVVTHGPHVGASYRGLVVLGQAVYGWPDGWAASDFATREGRAEAIRVTMARNRDKLEALD
jgi:hypothetical protein